MEDDLSFPEIDDGINDINKIPTNNKTVWIVNDNAPHKKIKCHINQKFIDKMICIKYAVTQKLVGDTEFGCFIKGKFVNNELYIDNDDIYIPEQEVTATSVDFKETPPEGYNGVIHKHPTGCSSFSGTDDTYINSNCEFSLLFENNTIKQAIINLMTVNGFRVQIPMTIVIDRCVSIKDIDVSGVNKVPPKTTLFANIPCNAYENIF